MAIDTRVNDALQEAYRDFRVAKREGDEEGMRRARQRGAALEAYIERDPEIMAARKGEARQTAVDETPAMQRAAIGLYDIGSSALENIGQFALTAPGPVRLAADALGVGEDWRQGIAERAATRSDILGPMQDDPAFMGAQAVATAAPWLRGARALGAMPTGQRLAVTAGGGGAELPAIVRPDVDPDRFLQEKAVQAGMGAGLGLAGEAIALARPAAATGVRRFLPQEELTAPSAGAAMTGAGQNRLQRLERMGVPISDAERAYIGSEGAVTPGMSAFEAGGRLQGSDLQEAVTRHRQAQQQAVEADLTQRSPITSQEAGQEIGETLSRDLDERLARETEAWDNLRVNEDAPLFGSGERADLLRRLRNTVEGERIAETDDVLGAFVNYLDNQLAAGDVGYTVGGISNLRRDINRFWDRAKKDPAQRRVMGQVRRDYENAIDELTGNVQTGPGVVEYNPNAAGARAVIGELREAVAASRAVRELTDGQIRIGRKQFKESPVSKMINEMQAGTLTAETAIERLISGRGDQARTFLSELERISGPEAAGRARELMRDAMLRRVIQNKVRDEGGRLVLRTERGYKALADQISQFLDTKRDLAGTLFTDIERQELRQFADSIRSLVPSNTIPNYSNTAGTAEFLRRWMKNIPFGQQVAEDAAERRMRSRIGLPGDSTVAQPRGRVLGHLLTLLETETPMVDASIRGAAVAGGRFLEDDEQTP